MQRVNKALAARQENSNREATYAYLAAVYKTARLIVQSDNASELRSKLGARSHGDGDFASVVGAILRRDEITKRQSQSRYAQALMLARHEKKNASEFEAFVAGEGGFNRCAAKLSHLRKKGKYPRPQKTKKRNSK